MNCDKFACLGRLMIETNSGVSLETFEVFTGRGVEKSDHLGSIEGCLVMEI